MRDFKYEQLITGDETWRPMMQQFQTIRSECLKPCKDAYVMNLGRSTCFARFPLDVAYLSIVDTRGLFNSIYRATGKGELSAAEILNALGDRAIHEKIRAE